MPDPKLVYWRDNNNGGKFDGNCYVDTGQSIPNAYYGRRFRFKISEFQSGVELRS